MSNTEKKLSEALGIEPSNTEDYPVVIQQNPETEDAAYARENIRGLITIGTTAINELGKVAKESEHPRAYEVLSNLIRNVSEMNKDLLNVQKMKKELNGEEKSSPSVMNVDKAVFVGTTADLIKLRKQEKENKDNNG